MSLCIILSPSLICLKSIAQLLLNEVSGTAQCQPGDGITLFLWGHLDLVLPFSDSGKHHGSSFRDVKPKPNKKNPSA